MEHDLEQALKILRSGGIILYPTDTIWGIGCDATLERAVQKILEIKKRPADKGLIILVDSKEMLLNYIPEIPDYVIPFLSEQEKPTTVIYPKGRGLAPTLFHQDGSVGIRLTFDKFCCHLIHRFGKPLVSTSANYSGSPFPADFSRINPGLIAKVDYAVSWRRHEMLNAHPSRVIKVTEENKINIIRK